MSSKNFSFATLVALAIATMMYGGLPVYAVTIPLSTDSSNSLDPSLLDATFEFSVVSNQLLLTVSNLTPEDPLSDPALRIDEVYFNAKDNITGLDLVGVSQGNTNRWVWEFLQGGSDGGVGNPHQVDGFGKFDMYVKDKPGNPVTYIDSETSLTFTFNIYWTGTALSDTDFIELSTQVDNHIPSYAAAKFYNGDGISGHGATTIPEPATVFLLGLGALALLRKRRQ